MAKIGNPGDLRKWLEGKPTEWAQALALRSALRVLPVALDPSSNNDIVTVSRLTQALLRATAISWAARNIPAHDMIGRAAANAAANADADIWAAIRGDCDFLENTDFDAQAGSLALLAQSLWYGKALLIPERELEASWQRARGNLEAEKLDIWIDWYHRRLTGKAQAFDLPRAADLEIQSRLLDQDNDWWERGLEAVTADIESWVDEARPNGPPSQIPEQNTYALSYRSDDTGVVHLDGLAGADDVGSDEDARERYDLAKSTANTLRESCGRTDAGGSLKGTLDNYLAAIGEEITDIKPNPVALYGDMLRNILSEQTAEDPDPMLMPLSSEMTLELKGWQAAHNMMVILDPELEKRDKALYGPDIKKPDLSLNDAKPILADAVQNDIVDEETRDGLGNAIANGEIDENDNGRRSLFAWESVRNLPKEIIRWMYENKLIVGGAAGGGITATYKGVSWIQRNKEFLLNVFADNPTMIEWINWIAALPL